MAHASGIGRVRRPEKEVVLGGGHGIAMDANQGAIKAVDATRCVVGRDILPDARGETGDEINSPGSRPGPAKVRDGSHEVVRIPSSQ